MEKFKPESVYAGRIWLKEWKRKSWTSTKLGRAREEPSQVEETPWNGGEYEGTRDIKLESGEKTARQEFSPCLENTTCTVWKANRRSQQKRRR